MRIRALYLTIARQRKDSSVSSARAVTARPLNNILGNLVEPLTVARPSRFFHRVRRHLAGLPFIAFDLESAGSRQAACSTNCWEAM